MLVHKKTNNRLMSPRLIQIGICTVAFLTACGPKASPVAPYTVVKSYVEIKNVIIPQLQDQSEIQLQQGQKNGSKEAIALQKDIENHHARILYLPHLQTLSVEQAEAIADHGGKIYLNGISNLSSDVALTLFGGHFEELHLDGLQNISPKVAKEIYNHGSFSTHISLNGLQSTHLDVMQYLIHSGSYLSLKNLKTIQPSPTAHLSSKKRRRHQSVYLPALSSLTSTVAQPLLQHPGAWSLNGLQEIDEDVLKIMGSSPITSLELNGLTSLSAQQALLLQNPHPKQLTLNGIQKIDGTTATALAQNNILSLTLNGIQKIEEQNLHILLQNPSMHYISLDGLTNLKDAHLRHLAQFHGSSISISGIQNLDVPQAHILAQFRGSSITLTKASQNVLNICKICDTEI